MPLQFLSNSLKIPDACAFESDFLNTYEKSRIHGHVAVAIVIMFMPEVPDYTVTFISPLSSASKCFKIASKLAQARHGRRILRTRMDACMFERMYAWRA